MLSAASALPRTVSVLSRDTKAAGPRADTHAARPSVSVEMLLRAHAIRCIAFALPRTTTVSARDTRAAGTPADTHAARPAASSQKQRRARASRSAASPLARTAAVRERGEGDERRADGRSSTQAETSVHAQTSPSQTGGALVERATPACKCDERVARPRRQSRTAAHTGVTEERGESRSVPRRQRCGDLVLESVVALCVGAVDACARRGPAGGRVPSAGLVRRHLGWRRWGQTKAGVIHTDIVQ